MQLKTTRNPGATRLLVFFQGWGMDEAVFPFADDPALDLALLFDYQDLVIPGELQNLVPDYAEIYLAGWSMGVWVLSRVLPSLSLTPQMTIAINGTLSPIHENYGINPEIFDATLNALDHRGRDKFIRRMFASHADFERFAPLMPRRLLESQKEELAALKKFILENPEPSASAFTHIIITQNDRIIPTPSQQRFWEEKSDLTPLLLPGGHYPFFNWKTWRELLCLP